MPVRNLIILCISMAVSMLCYKRAVHNRFATMIGESIDIIKNQYVEEVDDEKLFEDAMSGMVSGLDDYSSFIMRSEFSQFQSALDQRFGGIGIVVELPTAMKRLTVLSPVVGTPAFRAGLRAGRHHLRDRRPRHARHDLKGLGQANARLGGEYDPIEVPSCRRRKVPYGRDCSRGNPNRIGPRRLTSRWRRLEFLFGRPSHNRLHPPELLWRQDGSGSSQGAGRISTSIPSTA